MPERGSGILFKNARWDIVRASSFRRIETEQLITNLVKMDSR